MNYNPYAAPQAQPPMPGAPVPGGGAQPWEVGEVLGIAWDGFKPNWATLVFTFLLGGFIASVPRMIPGLLVGAQVISQQDDSYWPIFGACTLVGILIQAFFQVGLTKIWLDVARGATPSFGDMFAGGSRYVPMLGAMLLQALAIMIGYVMLIVPGVILALGLSLTQFYVVDRNMGPIDAMKASWEATKGQKGKIFVFGLAACLVMLGGMLACCIGTYVAFPVVWVAAAVMYLRMSGQASASSGGGGYGGPPAPYGGGGAYGPSAGYGPPPGGGYGPPPPGGFGSPPG